MIKKEGELEATAREEIEELEKLLEIRDLAEEEEWALSENLLRIKEIEENKTKDLKQKSRVRWAKEGDENSSFFHSMINCRKDVFEGDFVNVLNEFYSTDSFGILANRLKKVIASVISENQSAFLKGKFILDGPLIISETVNWLKKKKKKAFLFKLDFEKAYDNVNWGFVESVMTQMGFPQRWCRWVSGILSSARAAVLALTACFSKAVDLGLVEGVSLPNNGPILSHLFFVDDAFVFGEWSRESILNVVRILRCFRICSGLSINLVKSSLIGIGISDSEVVALAADIGCKAEQFPFKYLGLPVGANMNRISNWNSVVDMFEARLSLWKASVLSIGGRVTLIKSVLQSLPIYYFSLFKVPVGVIKQLEAIMRKFLWGGTGADRKTCWVSWECVTSPISSGGLGIRKLGHVNSALLFKWAWRFKAEGNSLWAKVVLAVHSHNRS
ncbi:uncharacterized protein LOC110887939 [Helianthus annuus]|uniref:uncharacterized protein LOC110887939 n=1 Tax=Helianthus annuus TaxID=4232 RepID=UPI000B905461|nr:uncharacterized protein LOC110887939 [Helianthus annuus]